MPTSSIRKFVQSSTSSYKAGWAHPPHRPAQQDGPRLCLPLTAIRRLLHSTAKHPPASANVTLPKSLSRVAQICKSPRSSQLCSMHITTSMGIHMYAASCTDTHKHTYICMDRQACINISKCLNCLKPTPPPT